MEVANVNRLAFCAGNAAPLDANAAVVEIERGFGGKDFANVVISTAVGSVLGLGLTAYLAWQLVGFIGGAIFGSQ